MEDKPPFILYNKNSKTLSSRLSNYKPQKDKINLIFSRIPQDVLENSKEVKSVIFKERKPIYDIINLDKKPNKIKIYNNMSLENRENVEIINSFREYVYEFNQEENDLLEDAEKVQKENKIFGNQYHNLQNRNNKYKTGTYLDHDYLIPIANRYNSKGIKVPKMNNDKSVFSGNPLILSGSELEEFIVYNLGDRQKGTNFLERLDEIMERKINGNSMLSSEELKRLKELDRPENRKGYVPPDILIPKLQDEIEMSKDTIKNIKDLDLFFQKKKGSDNNIKLNHNSLSFLENSENINDKIRIKKNLPSLKKFNNDNNILNNNDNISRNMSTIDYLPPRSPKIFSSQTNSDINSPKSKVKSNLFIFSRLPSSSRNKNKFEDEETRFTFIKNLYKEQKNRKANLPNISYLIKNRKGRFSSLNIHNNKRKSIQNNSVDAENKIFSRNSLKLQNFSEEKIEEKTNSNESEKSELELIRELGHLPKMEIKKKLNLDLSDNNNSNINDKINRNKEKKRTRKRKLTKIKIKKIKDDKNLIKTEKMFNLVLKNENIDKNRKQIEKFLEKRGYDTSRAMDNQLLFKNMDRVEKGMQKKVLQEQYKIRGESVTTKYKQLLEKDDILSKQIEENTLKFKKMIYEINVDKDIDE